MTEVKIKPNQMEQTVYKLLSKYGDEAKEIAAKVVTDNARQAVKELKGTAPTGGRYAKGWSHKSQKSGRFFYSDTVHNRTDYQLTHLLEEPHVTGKGTGHYPTHVDYTGTLADVERKYSEKFERELISKL